MPSENINKDGMFFAIFYGIGRMLISALKFNSVLNAVDALVDLNIRKCKKGFWDNSVTLFMPTVFQDKHFLLQLSWRAFLPHFNFSRIGNFCQEIEVTEKIVKKGVRG
jgi:hypothetical protein